ncbi:hypothetical protein [Rhodococcus rhodochrous]|uniref:hypothetical protein n=1 Tax=Rhodococcus rhodochrous TaxID=1829 RepID=UPI0012FDF307|nr:hypothetical protein [Rhodococcus rhodochrous]
MFEALKKEQQPAVRDRVIVFDKDKRTVEILPVEAQNEERVMAGEKSIPLADLELFLSSKGRVYVVNAPTEYLEATENLARVEKNTIIRQIAQYKKPFDEKAGGFNWQTLVLIGGLILVAIIAAAK